MHITPIGIDIGKTTFHLVALDEHGSMVVRKKFSRKQLLTYTAKPPKLRLDKETSLCNSSSDWGLMLDLGWCPKVALMLSGASWDKTSNVFLRQILDKELCSLEQFRSSVHKCFGCETVV